MSQKTTDNKTFPKLKFDHLVVAATTLQAGIDYVERLLAVPLEKGGQHVQMGTHNALLRLGSSRYLEVIAIDPDLPEPSAHRWFGLDNRLIRARLKQSACLLHWVARTTNLSLTLQKAPLATQRIISMSRGQLNWQITCPQDGSLPGQGLIPSLIQWSTQTHPAYSLPDRGCQLQTLEATTPDPREISRALHQLHLSDTLAVTAGRETQLRATITTPKGLCYLE